MECWSIGVMGNRKQHSIIPLLQYSILLGQHVDLGFDLVCRDEMAL